MVVQGTGDNNVGTHSVSHDNDGDRGNVFDIDGGENAAGYSNGNYDFRKLRYDVFGKKKLLCCLSDGSGARSKRSRLFYP